MTAEVVSNSFLRVWINCVEGTRFIVEQRRYIWHYLQSKIGLCLRWSGKENCVSLAKKLRSWNQTTNVGIPGLVNPWLEMDSTDADLYLIF